MPEMSMPKILMAIAASFVVVVALIIWWLVAMWQAGQWDLDDVPRMLLGGAIALVVMSNTFRSLVARLLFALPQAVYRRIRYSGFSAFTREGRAQFIRTQRWPHSEAVVLTVDTLPSHVYLEGYFEGDNIVMWAWDADQAYAYKLNSFPYKTGVLTDGRFRALFTELIKWPVAGRPQPVNSEAAEAAHAHSLETAS